jgi:hypothetical protein
MTEILCTMSIDDVEVAGLALDAWDAAMSAARARKVPTVRPAGVKAG